MIVKARELWVGRMQNDKQYTIIISITNYKPLRGSTWMIMFKTKKLLALEGVTTASLQFVPGLTCRGHHGG